MAHFSLVLVSLIFFILSSAFAGESVKISSHLLGEKKIDGYYQRYYPIVDLERYTGRLFFLDNDREQFYFKDYLFSDEKFFNDFFKYELSSNLVCSDETLMNHFDDLRFSYRLITLSYLIEAQSHLKALNQMYSLGRSCDINFDDWIGQCRPKSEEMKKYLQRLKAYWPEHTSEIPKTYQFDNWKKDFKNNDFKYYSHYVSKNKCHKNCSDNDFKKILETSCLENSELMNLICSEEDYIYGLSQHRESYSLLGQSQIINTFNKNGEALSCLRRFSEINSFREVNYQALNSLFPVIQDFLKSKFKERYLQGRSFHLGAFKEFEQKGLSESFVKSKKFEVTSIKEEIEKTPVITNIENNEKKELPLKVEAKDEPQIIKIEKKEILEIPKSAFLQASELRRSQGLDIVEVDMLKLKYDYVFTLNTRNKLSLRLKTFMTRDALQEMANFDKLGTNQGPVPLLFLKYMIDMQEHQGLWNLVSVLGESFFVSNEIDPSYKPQPERIKLQNDPSFDGGWRIFVLEP